MTVMNKVSCVFIISSSVYTEYPEYHNAGTSTYPLDSSSGSPLRVRRSRGLSTFELECRAVAGRLLEHARVASRFMVTYLWSLVSVLQDCV